LPDPDRPRSATSWPRDTAKETPRSARTAVLPLPKTLITSLTATIAPGSPLTPRLPPKTGQ